MTVPEVLILLAVALMIAGPLLGLVLFRPDRARDVKRIELERATTVLIEQASYFRLLHPEMVHSDRLDRNDPYVWLHVGLWMYGLGTLLSPAPNANIAAIDWATQKMLGACLLFGSSIALSGVMLGLGHGRMHIARRISRNPLSELLGDDIRVPYLLGFCGLVSVAVSMVFYAVTIYVTSASRLLGTLGGGLSMAIGGMCVTLGVRLLYRIRHYSKSRNLLIAEADARAKARTA